MDILYASLSMTIDKLVWPTRFSAAFCLQLLRESEEHYSISRDFTKRLTKLQTTISKLWLSQSDINSSNSYCGIYVHLKSNPWDFHKIKPCLWYYLWSAFCSNSISMYFKFVIISLDGSFHCKPTSLMAQIAFTHMGDSQETRHACQTVFLFVILVSSQSASMFTVHSPTDLTELC